MDGWVSKWIEIDKVDELHHREDDDVDPNDDDLDEENLDEDDLDGDDQHLWAVEWARVLALATWILTTSNPENCLSFF